MAFKCCAERKGRLGPSPAALSKPHFLLLFILVSGGNNAERWMFASTRDRVAGRAAPSGRWSVWTRPTMGSTWPTFLHEADPRAAPCFPPPTLLKPGVTVPALKREQLAAARVACSYRPDSLPDVFRSNSSQPASQPAARPASEPGTHSDCKTRSRVGKNKNKKSRGGGEKTGRCFSLTTPPT